MDEHEQLRHGALVAAIDQAGAALRDVARMLGEYRRDLQLDLDELEDVWLARDLAAEQHHDARTEYGVRRTPPQAATSRDVGTPCVLPQRAGGDCCGPPLRDVRATGSSDATSISRSSSNHSPERYEPSSLTSGISST